MGMEVLQPRRVRGTNTNMAIAPKYGTNFGNQINADTFEFRTVNRYMTEPNVRRMLAANPKLQKMVREINPEMKLNIAELQELCVKHAADTQSIAKGIVENLPYALQNKVNMNAINDAAKLHDIGKVFIPNEILNKPAKLTDKEIEIMHKHSELGYELLKPAGVNPDTLNLVRYHHQNAAKTGYPKADKDFNADINQQILSVADKYSALREQRPYKAPMSNKQALTIIYKDMKEGNISPFVFRALVDYANTVSAAAKVSA